MLSVFDTVFPAAGQASLRVGTFLLCIAVAVLMGGLYTLACSWRSRESKSFRAAVFFLPAVIAVTIIMVNGNLGVGVAVAGAFSLIRFRSAPGSAKEIAAVFMTMCSGLIAGVGYLGYALLFTLVMCVLLVAANTVTLAAENRDRTRTLKITVPEDLHFEMMFDDLWQDYAERVTEVSVRTAAMGSLFRLHYELVLKPGVSEKDLLDAIRVRNGNLEVSLSRRETREDLL